MNRKIITIISALLMSSFVFVGVVMAATAVSNGSFEDGTPPGVFITVGNGDGDITDWEVDSGTVDYIGTYWKASDGDRSIDMSGNSAGSISQELETVPGHSYRVTFDMSGNPDGPDDVKEMTVSATGEAPVVYTYDLAVHQNTREDMKWVPEFYEFVATSTDTTLTFASGTPGFYGPALDNVSIELVDVSNVDQCKKGGWVDYGFKNQGQCIRFVNTGQDSRL